MNALLHLVFFGLTALVSGAGAYFGSYLKKKGENLATHEDIDKLLEQVSAVTKTTKEIEAKISDDVWSRQKRWEMKREVAFETAKKAARVTDRLSSLFAVCQTDSASQNADNPERIKKRIETMHQYTDAANALDEVSSLVGLVFGIEVRKAVFNFSVTTRDVAQDVLKGKPDAYTAATKLFAKQAETITVTMRKEMGIELEPSIEPYTPAALPT
jgi:hypothetical protein